MNEILVALPEYYNAVVDRLLRADWIVHNFRTHDLNDLYNPANYHYNIEFNNTEYRALIDLNILQYTVNCVKKDSMKGLYRDACALLIFCRVAEIQIEPALAVYERINYNAENLEEALDDLSLLRALDNADVDQLAQYVLGDIEALENVTPVEIDRETLGEQLTQYHRLTNWDSIYLLVLAAISIYWNTAISHQNKLGQYLDWMIQKFRLSLPCIIYAVRLFGHNPLSNMMKYKIGESEHSKRSATFNMTWDLYHIDHFFKNWIDPEKEREELFFTQDRVLHSLFRLAIEVQYSGDISTLLNYLTSSQASMCRSLIDGLNNRDDRVYGICAWSPEHREMLIRSLEKELYH